MLSSNPLLKLNSSYGHHYKQPGLDLLHGLHVFCWNPVVLYCDNEVALHIADNPITAQYVPFCHQLAYIFAESLAA